MIFELSAPKNIKGIKKSTQTKIVLRSVIFPSFFRVLQSIQGKATESSTFVFADKNVKASSVNQPDAESSGVDNRKPF